MPLTSERTKPTRTGHDPARNSGGTAGQDPAPRPGHGPRRGGGQNHRSVVRRARRIDADGMAVAAFVLGLVGLLVMNIVLGPTAIVLASLALWRGTARRGRALLGLTLGVADLVVLAALVTANGTVVWDFGG